MSEMKPKLLLWTHLNDKNILRLNNVIEVPHHEMIASLRAMARGPAKISAAMNIINRHTRQVIEGAVK